MSTTPQNPKAKANLAKVMNKVKAKVKGVWKKSREKEAKVKGSTVPAGITRGVAQFTSWKSDLDKNQNPYFSLGGVIIEPEEYAGIKLNISFFLKESETKTIEDKVDELCSAVKLLGGEIDEAEIDDLPEVLNGLKKVKPFFYFNTWKGQPTKKYPNPQTNVYIQGLADDYEAPEDDEEDEEEDHEEDNNGDEFAEMDRSALKAHIKENKLDITVTKGMSDDDIRDAIRALSEDEDEEEEEDEEEPDEEEDEEEDEKPTRKPKPKTKASGGKPPKRPANKTKAEEPEEEDDEEETFLPKKQDVFLYKASPKVKASEHEVIKVNAKAETVSIRNITSKKEYHNVPFTSLEGEDE